MQKLLLFTLLSIIFFNNTYPQWTNQNPVPDGNDLWSTFFINDNTGWIVGSDGFIKKTTNAGIDWIQQNSGTTLILKSIQFIDQNTGWICGETGLILKTTDGGLNWFPLTSGTTEHLTDIEFCDLNIGYAVGFSGTILKTTNGGSSWVGQSSGTSSDIYDVDFVDATLGYAFGGEYNNSVFLKTTNGGTSWIDKSGELPYTFGYPITAKFIDANTGFIGGGIQSSCYIYKTTDGGDTWVQSNISNLKPQEINQRDQISIYNFGGINSIYFKDSNIGYAVSGDESGCNSQREIYKTTDGGSTWDRTYVAYEQIGLISVYVNNAGEGWAVGFSGIIVITEDDGSSWAQMLSGTYNSYSSGDDILSVFFINENIGWAVGSSENCITDGSVILKTTNGGKIWKTQRDNFTAYGPIRSVYFINENIGWAVGEGTPGYYRTTDGGENWIEGGSKFSSIFFINQYTGWATKDNYDNGIYKSTDSGITWIQKSSVSSSSIYFSDLNTGWAVGEGGNILKSTDSGESWVIKTSGTTNDLNCVKFYDSNLGMCVGNEGLVLVTTDGGESWVTQNSGAINNLKAITFTNSNSVWIAGTNGTILNTTDLGTSWISENEVTENNLTSLCFADEYTGWIGGMNGTMFKYQNDVVPVELTSFTANVNDDVVKLNWQTATEINNQGFEIERCIDVDKWSNIGFVVGHGNSSLPNSYSFTDRNALGASKLKYRLKQVDIDGKYKYSNEVEVEIVPREFVLYQNYPNPFNPSTTIRFSLPKQTRLKINLYSILGELLETIAEGNYEAGNYKVNFNASNLQSGVYIYRIEGSDPSTGSGQSFVQVKKMILMK